MAGAMKFLGSRPRMQRVIDIQTCLEDDWTPQQNVIVQQGLYSSVAPIPPRQPRCACLKSIDLVIGSEGTALFLKQLPTHKCLTRTGA